MHAKTRLFGLSGFLSLIILKKFPSITGLGRKKPPIYLKINYILKIVNTF